LADLEGFMMQHTMLNWQADIMLLLHSNNSEL